MSKCRTCGAPLRDTPICAYCNTTNDIDLRGIHEYTVGKPSEIRTCPVCSCKLCTINISTGEQKYYIERCDQCMGLFFDPNELEGILESSVKVAYSIDFKKLDQLNQTTGPGSERVFYKKCPVCGKMMNRVNFGARSGVVVDKCRNHGIWLDGGELRHLFKWRKAGGHLYHEKVTEEKLKRQQRKKEIENINTLHQDMYFNDTLFRHANTKDSPNLLTLLWHLAGKIIE